MEPWKRTPYDTEQEPEFPAWTDLELAWRCVQQLPLLAQQLHLPARTSGSTVAVAWVARQLHLEPVVVLPDQVRLCYEALWMQFRRAVRRAQSQAAWGESHAAGLVRGLCSSPATDPPGPAFPSLLEVMAHVKQFHFGLSLWEAWPLVFSPGVWVDTLDDPLVREERFAWHNQPVDLYEMFCAALATLWDLTRDSLTRALRPAAQARGQRICLALEATADLMGAVNVLSDPEVACLRWAAHQCNWRWDLNGQPQSLGHGQLGCASCQCRWSAPPIAAGAPPWRPPCFCVPLCDACVSSLPEEGFCKLHEDSVSVGLGFQGCSRGEARWLSAWRQWQQELSLGRSDTDSGSEPLGQPWLGSVVKHALDQCPALAQGVLTGDACQRLMQTAQQLWERQQDVYSLPLESLDVFLLTRSEILQLDRALRRAVSWVGRAAEVWATYYQSQYPHEPQHQAPVPQSPRPVEPTTVPHTQAEETSPTYARVSQPLLQRAAPTFLPRNVRKAQSVHSPSQPTLPCRTTRCRQAETRPNLVRATRTTSRRRRRPVKKPRLY